MRFTRRWDRAPSGGRCPRAAALLPQIVEFAQRIIVGIDAQMGIWKRIAIDYHQRCRSQRLDLAAGGKPGGEAGQQTLFERPNRSLVAGECRGRNLLRVQQVAERHGRRAARLAVDAGTAGAMIGADAAHRVDQRHLAPFWKIEGLGSLAGGCVATDARLEQRQCARPDQRMRSILGHDGAHTRGRERAARADRDARRRHGPREPPGPRAARDDGIRHRIQPSLALG